jgi:hypothetical protein
MAEEEPPESLEPSLLESHCNGVLTGAVREALTEFARAGTVEQKRRDGANVLPPPLDLCNFLDDVGGACLHTKSWLTEPLAKKLADGASPAAD